MSDDVRIPSWVTRACEAEVSCMLRGAYHAVLDEARESETEQQARADQIRVLEEQLADSERRGLALAREVDQLRADLKAADMVTISQSETILTLNASLTAMRAQKARELDGMITRLRQLGTGVETLRGEVVQLAEQTKVAGRG